MKLTYKFEIEDAELSMMDMNGKEWLVGCEASAILNREDWDHYVDDLMAKNIRILENRGNGAFYVNSMAEIPSLFAQKEVQYLEEEMKYFLLKDAQKLI